MRAIEILAAVAGVIGVYLSVRQNPLTWPIGLVNVGLSTVVFWHLRLYSTMGLQVVYFVQAIYGWYHWRFGGANRTELPVSRLPRGEGIILCSIAIVAWAGLSRFVDRQTDQALPYVDSALGVSSLVGQWMLTRKYVENWILWVVIDVAYVAMLISQRSYWMAALYAVFVVLATRGLVEWRRSLRRAPA